jgi:hypothetical protein
MFIQSLIVYIITNQFADHCVWMEEVGCGGMDWIGMAHDWDRWRALVSAVMNLRVPQNAGNFLTSWQSASFSRRTLLHGVSYVWMAFLLANVGSAQHTIIGLPYWFWFWPLKVSENSEMSLTCSGSYIIHCVTAVPILQLPHWPFILDCT